MLSVLTEARTYVALPIALLAAYAYLVDRTGPQGRPMFRFLLGEAAAAGAAVALTGAGDSPMLPYLLAPGLCLGLTGTRGQQFGAALAAVLGLVVGRLAAPALDRPVGTVEDLAVQAGQWVLLGLALGLLAHWARHLSQPAPPSSGERYEEARELLAQLRSVARRLPGGLDVGSAAEALLDQCYAVRPATRSAVLVQTGGSALVPVAVRGTRRVPWRAPLSEPGPLQRAWDERSPVVDRRQPDVHGRRTGSTLAVLPLLSGETSFGLLVLEWIGSEQAPDDVLDGLRDVAEEGALRLETALLFEEVRSAVTLEERDRLAREMHDGVAQELAFVGYQLDALRTRAAKVDEGLAHEAGEVRKGLTRLVSDIRLSITDLKTSVSHERGLGTAISSYVRAVGSGGGIAVHLSLQEASFRLPADAEVALFQIAQAVAQDVRRNRQASNLWVTLAVDPPSARLRVEHDGPGPEHSGLDLSEHAEQVRKLGGTVRTEARPGSGVCVDVVLEGGKGGDLGTAGR